MGERQGDTGDRRRHAGDHEIADLGDGAQPITAHDWPPEEEGPHQEDRLGRLAEHHISAREIDHGRQLRSEQHHVEGQHAHDRVEPGCGASRKHRTDAVGKQGDHDREHEHLLEHVHAETPVGNLAQRGQEGGAGQQRTGVERRAVTSGHDPILAERREPPRSAHRPRPRIRRNGRPARRHRAEAGFPRCPRRHATGCNCR